MFLCKADIEIADDVLKGLARRNPGGAVARTPIIADIVASVFAQPADVAPLQAQGTFHLVHRARFPSGRTLIVRSSLPDIFPSDDRLLIEQSVFPLLGPLGLHVPAIHLTSVGDRDRAAFDFVIMDEAPGQGLQFMSESEQDDPAIWRALGTAVRRLHTVQGEGAGPLLPRRGEEDATLRATGRSWHEYVLSHSEAHVARCLRSGMLAEAEAEEISRHFAELPWDREPASALLHGDLGNHNVFVKDKRVLTLVDWEDALLGDPVFDVAMWATFNPARRHAPFFDGYGARVHDEHFRLTFSAYFLRITLAKAVVRQRFGYTDVPGRPTMRERIMSGLAAVRRAMSNSTTALFG
jgi:aminoglycoside phosphotransferase (APT) family kinase protein